MLVAERFLVVVPNVTGGFDVVVKTEAEMMTRAEAEDICEHETNDEASAFIFEAVAVGRKDGYRLEKFGLPE